MYKLSAGELGSRNFQGILEAFFSLRPILGMYLRVSKGQVKT